MISDLECSTLPTSSSTHCTALEYIQSACFRSFCLANFKYCTERDWERRRCTTACYLCLDVLMVGWSVGGVSVYFCRSENVWCNSAQAENRNKTSTLRHTLCLPRAARRFRMFLWKNKDEDILSPRPHSNLSSPCIGRVVRSIFNQFHCL